MRLAALSISLLALALAACGTAAPDVATIPHATLAGTHVNAIGAYRPDMCELPAAL